MKIYWNTTERTKGYFLAGIKKKVIIIDHQEIKSQYSTNNFIKCIQVFNLFKRENITHIIIDGFSIENLVFFIIAKSLNVDRLARVRGGMCNEYLDDVISDTIIIRSIKLFWFNFVRNRILSIADYIMTVSNFCSSQVLLECPLINSRRIFTLIKPTLQIQNPLSLKENKLQKEYWATSETKIIATITSFRYYRKYEALIYYHKPIIEFLASNPDWVWIIAGDGKGLNNAKQSILQTACDAKIVENIHFRGFVNDVESLLNCSDIFFYPTFRDSASQIVKEAQLHNLPTIINRTSGGPLEFIPPVTDCQKQIFAEPKELKAILNELSVSKNYRERIGAINKKFALENYCVEKIANRFFEIVGTKYDDIIP